MIALGVGRDLNHLPGAITDTDESYDKYAAHQLNVEFAITNFLPCLMISRVCAGVRL
jgi:hypothetical protein